MNENKLNVLVVADVSPLQTTGGSARVIREQALGLSRLGHSVHVLCRQPGGDLLPAGALNGVPLEHYAVERSHPLSYASSSIFGARALFRDRFRNRSWDVVLFNQPFSTVGIQGALPPSVPRVYCFYSPAGTEYRLRAADPKSGRVPLGTGWASGLLRRLERRALAASDRIVVLSDFSRVVLQEAHPELRVPSVAIAGGVDLDHFRPAGDRAAVRARLQLPKDDLLLLTIRDLEQRMGIDTLLRALRSFSPERSFRCLVGGNGPLRGFLESLAAELGLAERVRFLGYISEGELPLYYQAADLFVLPSRCHEGFGLVTVEALACGTPVVATPAGATPEILAPLDSRLLAADSEETALADALTRALSFTGAESFRAACRRYAESRFAWTRHVELLEKELQGVVAAKRLVFDGPSPQV